ncbi:MAG: type pilus assembly protein PilX [Pseudomonadota bacterium]|nr:type pilus assembly protein PilX [Pseudomonadota bacterium]
MQGLHIERRRTRGFSLVTVLLLIAVMASLGAGAMSAGLLQERMAGHARDRQLALQAAEAALRDAEVDVERHLSRDSAFTPDCTDGLCLPPSMASTQASSRPLWQTIDWSAAAGRSRALGQATGAAALTGLAAPPRYIIERLPPLAPQAGTSASLAGSADEAPQVFRITARGVGLRNSTVVILQSTYIKR